MKKNNTKTNKEISLEEKRTVEVIRQVNTKQKTRTYTQFAISYTHTHICSEMK